MKTLFLLLVLSLPAAYAFMRRQPASAPGNRSAETLLAYKKSAAIGCGTNTSGIDFADSANAIPLLPGWGTYEMPVTATHDSSRIYFEQGINLYYGFHVIEALASFEKALRFDSSFAMGHWGKALAYGPNINDFGYSTAPEALTAVRQATLFSASCTPTEKALIDAIGVRYSADTAADRARLDQRYADAMAGVHHRFPESADAAALYVDALMLQHPWDLYTRTFQPKPWTPRIVATLEQLLKRTPDHPGAAHYYIHAVEGSAQPERGLAAARSLPELMPGVAHVVHMPSHIYIRSGYYQTGEDVNKRAVKSYYDYASRFPLVANNAPLYLVHNLHMQASCANMGGRFKEAWTASVDCRNSFDSSWQALPGFMGIYSQYLYMTPYLTLIRFGKWQELLSTPAIPATHVYARLLWHYGRGLAFARKHEFVNVQQELAAMRVSLAHDQMKAPAPSYSNSGIVGGSVALTILKGVLEEEQNKLPEAIASLQHAVALEDSMQYNEPRDWVHPARHYLGNVLLKAGRYAAAESVFQADLRINPRNGWALTGLASALAKQGKTKAAVVARYRAAKARASADVPIRASVF